jgi:hypothetical protein
MQEIRYLDKLIDELAKGKSMEKIYGANRLLLRLSVLRVYAKNGTVFAAGGEVHPLRRSDRGSRRSYPGAAARAAFDAKAIASS